MLTSETLETSNTLLYTLHENTACSLNVGWSGVLLQYNDPDTQKSEEGLCLRHKHMSKLLGKLFLCKIQVHLYFAYIL